MRIDTRILNALLALASTLGAQGTANCIKPPVNNPTIINNGQVVADTVEFKASIGNGFLVQNRNNLFGITGYRCPACESKRAPGHPIETSFLAEPVVESVTSATPVKPGDIIEAVNGQPITSSAGSKQFSDPTGGVTTLTVRRGRERVVLNLTLPPACRDTTIYVYVPFSIPRRFPSESTIRIRGTSKLANGPLYVIDGVPVSSIDGVRHEAPSPPAGRYGFALSCTPDCGQLTIPDGTTYYSYRVAPKVTAIRDDSPAAAIGLKVGDVIVKVDGHSILEDDGALALARSDKKESLRLTVLRDGKEISLLFQAPR